MHFTPEELRRLWLDLYRDEVTRLASKGVDRDSLHPAASAHADRHVRCLGEPATSAPPVRTVEDERLDVLAFLRLDMSTNATANRYALVDAFERGDHIGAANREAVKP